MQIDQERKASKHRALRALVGLILTVLIVGVSDAQVRAVQSKVFHREAAPWQERLSMGAGFQESTVVSGDWMFIPRDEVWSVQPRSRVVRVLVYKRLASGWSFRQELRAPYPQPDFNGETNAFGQKIKVVDGIACIGAYLATEGSASPQSWGRVYVYRLIGDTWLYQQSLGPLTFGGDLGAPGFGYSFSFDGEHLVVGARGTDPPQAAHSGVVYVYKLNGQGRFDLLQWIEAPGPPLTTAIFGGLGFQVLVDGEMMLVSTSGTSNPVFEYRLGLNGWYLNHEFSRPWQGNQQWGVAMASHGDRIAISSHRGTGLTPSPGDVVVVYRRASAGGWQQEAFLTISGPGQNPGDFPSFGNDLQLGRDWLLVGAPGVNIPSTPHDLLSVGAAYLYHKNAGSGWTLAQSFRHSDWQQSQVSSGAEVGWFGLSVGADWENGQLLINAFSYREPGAIPGTFHFGGVYMFDLERGDRFCSQGPNSTGSVSELSVIGSLEVARNNFTLHGYGLPPGELALALYGREGPRHSVVTGGSLCLTGGGGIQRVFPAIAAGESGEMFLDLDLSNAIHAGSLMPGTTWAFQVWHRDQVAGASTTNMTHAVRVTME